MQFITCHLGDQTFALDIRYVREVNRARDVTTIPLELPHVRGLINLRGQIVTIFDLGLRLGMTGVDDTDHTHTIIIKHGPQLIKSFAGELGQVSAIADPVGLTVEGVGDVIEADFHAVEQLPANMGDLDGRFLNGILKHDDALIGVLDIPQVLRYGMSQDN